MWKHKQIPQTCFFYWGNTKLSFLNYLSLVSFKENNPDWKIVLARPTDNLIVEPPTPHHSQGYVGEKDYMHQALRAADDVLKIDFEKITGTKKELHDVQRADLTRLYVLSEYGGMWSDMDILYVKSNTNINFQKYLISGTIENFDTSICYCDAGAGHNYNSTGALFSSKNNSMYKYLFNKAAERIISLGENNVGDYQMVGPSLLNSYVPDLIDKMPELNVANIAYKVFYPWGWWGEIEGFFNRKNETRITDETIAVHWFKGDPNSAKHLNKDPQTADSSSHFGFYILKYKELW
tara:strand:+ start:98 stop:976 length:879 start_codon:yes stop_codon:yes gene_type:complete